MEVDNRIGTDFAGYRIESVLGRGGMGVVYLATDTRLGRQVALKLLSPDLSADQRFRDRFIQESRMAAGLEHHGIVPVHEAGEHEGQLYIAMRHIAGDDLASLIERDGPLSLDRTASVVEQVADALDTAHERGLIHRDVKPANILVETGRRDRAFLTDFGVTKRTTSTSGLTQTGQFMGTVDYVAPEQIEGKDADGRADQYSLGCVAYECLTGQPPFAKDSEVATIYAHLQEDRPRPSVKQPHLPKVVDGVLTKAMAKRPTDRYETCGGMAEALRQAAGSVGAAPAAGPARRRLLVALAGVLVVAAVATVLVLTRTSSRGGQGAAPSPTLGRPAPLIRIDPGTNRIVRSFEVAAISVAEGGDAVWALTPAEVLKINAETNQIVARVPIRTRIGLFGGSEGMAVGEGGVWVAHPPSFVHIDPARNEVSAELDADALIVQGQPVGALDPTAATVGLGRVWVAYASAGFVAEIDPATNQILGTTPINNANSVAVGEGSVWVTNSITDVVFRLDPRSGKVVKRIPVPGAANDVAVGAGSVWVSNGTDGTVLRIDPTTNLGVATIPVGRRPTGVAVGEGSVWVTNTLDGTVSRIDPATNRVVKTIPYGQCAVRRSAGISAGDAGVWVITSCRF